MSRIGKQPITLPKEVKVTVENGTVWAEGSKGKLSLVIPKGIRVEVADSICRVKRENDTKQSKSLHGTIQALISNMIKGLTETFKRELEIIGVGYKVQIKDKNIILNIGFSHPVEMEIPEGLKVSAPSATRVVIEGVDKQKVGEFAARIRRVYPPEPYKGKGIRYAGEEVRKKLGKALAK